MNETMDHQSAYDQLEAYTFGTLERSEMEAVTAHLDTGCQACLARLRELGELSARLAAAVPQHDVSPALKERLLTGIRPERRAPRPSPSPWSRFGWVLAAASTAAVVVLALWGAGLRNEMTALNDDLQASRDEVVRLRGDMSAFEAAMDLLGKPCTRLVDLAGVDPNPQAFGKVVLHPDERFGIIYVYRLPPTPEGMEYQLWSLRDGKPVSIGVFNVPENGNAVFRLHTLPDPSSIAEFQVTIEPIGGRPAPTGMQYLKGQNTLSMPH